MSIPISADQRAGAVASQQAGAIAHRQAVRAGLSDDQVEHRCRAGIWIRRARGVYVISGSSDTPEQRLWVAYLAVQAAGGVISHLSAVALLGLGPFPPLPQVTVPRTGSVDSRTAKVYRGYVPAVDRVRRDRLEVTSVSRTIADCAALLDRSSFERLVDAALCRKLATADSVASAAVRAGRRRHGAVLLRETLTCWHPRIEPGSPAEVRLLRCLGEQGLEDLVTQYDVHDLDGTFVARLDIASPRLRAGFEYDGVEVHGPRAWPRDEPRYAALRRLGWRVEGVTKIDLLPGEQRIRRIVQRWTR